MRSSLSLGVCVCSLALLLMGQDGGCGGTADGGDPGSGGDNRGPGGTPSGDNGCTFTAEGAVDAHGPCGISSWGSDGRLSTSIGGGPWVGGILHRVEVLMGPDDTPLQTGDVLTEGNDASGTSPWVWISFSADNEFCVDELSHSQDPACYSSGNRDAYECESADGDDPAIGTFTITYNEFDLDASIVNLTIDATCPGPEGDVDIHVQVTNGY